MKKSLVSLLFICIAFAHINADSIFPAYPKLLEEKVWDKAIDIEEVDGNEDDEAREVEKSIGDLLKNLKKLYNKIDLKKFDPLMAKSTKEWNFINLQEFKEEVLERVKKSPKKPRAKLKKLIDELGKAKKAWKKDKSVSKDDKKDLDETLKAAKKFKKQIDKKALTKKVKAAFKDTKKRLVKKSKKAWIGAGKIIDNLDKSAGTITSDEYSTFQSNKAPLVKQAFALTFGKDSDEYSQFEDVVIDVSSDEEARTQAAEIVAVARSIILTDTLKNTGLY